MSSTTSILKLIEASRAGGDHSELLWTRYTPRMQRLANGWIRRMSGHPVRNGNSELDEAFESFYQSLVSGRYSELRGSDELWRLLAVIAMRRVVKSSQSEADQQEGLSEDRIDRLDASLSTDTELFEDLDLPPDFSAGMAVECRRLLRLLDDPELEALVLWKLEGFTNDEIAEHMGRTRRTIQRMLRLVRQIWEAEFQ